MAVPGARTPRDKRMTAIAYDRKLKINTSARSPIINCGMTK